MDIRNTVLTIVVGYFTFIPDTLGQSTTIGTASRKGAVSIGISAGHYDYDPAIGLEVTSPGILNNFRFRLKVNHNWSERYQAASGHWANFNSYWCAFIYNTDAVDRTRIFLESGAYLIQPNKVFSSAKMHTGCFAAIGVEFFVAPNTRERFSYFFSGGFAAINARADKLEGRPHYGHGFIFTNGFRYFFLPR
ncbi:MAG TPA: hypothetical protein VGD65_24220 [Chryseosolibacter sp.]